MTNLSSGVDSFGTTGLEHLTYNELTSYADMLLCLSKRDIDMLERGFDTKAMYHVVRLLNEVEQIMVEHDLDLERNREQLKSIRRGEWSMDQLKKYFTEKEKALETVYANSTLPHGPDEDRIKQLLLDCLEAHYGDISTAVARNPSMDALLEDMRNLISNYTVKGSATDHAPHD